MLSSDDLVVHTEMDVYRALARSGNPLSWLPGPYVLREGDLAIQAHTPPGVQLCECRWAAVDTSARRDDFCRLFLKHIRLEFLRGRELQVGLMTAARSPSLLGAEVRADTLSFPSRYWYRTLRRTPWWHGPNRSRGSATMLYVKSSSSRLSLLPPLLPLPPPPPRPLAHGLAATGAGKSTALSTCSEVAARTRSTSRKSGNTLPTSRLGSREKRCVRGSGQSQFVTVLLSGSLCGVGLNCRHMACQCTHSVLQMNTPRAFLGVATLSNTIFGECLSVPHRCSRVSSVDTP